MNTQVDTRPAWQTDELADEWIEEEQDHAEPPTQQQQHCLPASHSASCIQGTCDFGTTNFNATTSRRGLAQHQQIGTFVVREDLPPPILPQTPGKAKGGIKDMFSPLQLEKMFEPPSPPGKSSTPARPNATPMSRQRLSSRPARPSKLSQVISASFLEEDGEKLDEIVETDMPNIGSFGNFKPSPNCRFTFSVPRVTPDNVTTSRPNTNGFTNYNPQAQSTPSQVQAQNKSNPNDSRLRLFQFHYDTYTRDQLSALVDSFGVSSPSNGSTSKNSVGSVLLKLPNEREESNESFSRLRASKRLKLTTPAELVDGTRRLHQPPAERFTFKKDYVGEARSLTQQIKRTRDFSMASIANAAERGPLPPAPSDIATASVQVPDERSNRPASSAEQSSSTTETSNNERFSSLAYRRQAEDLMAKIKGDRRMFSEKTDGDRSFSSQEMEDDNADVQERSTAPSPETRLHSPLKRRFVEKDNDSDRDPDPPSYAASIARSNFMASTKRNKRQLDADFGVKDRSKFPVQWTERNLVVMPVVIPDVHAPADRVRSPNPTFLAPPATALSSVRFSALTRTESTNDDLNRLVSSGSTATTATTLTAGSAGSGVKHAGPAQMVRIAPTDLPALPDRVGGMMFDRNLGRWVKERESSDRSTARPTTREPSGVVDGSSSSEDPFRDIESLRDEDSSRVPNAQDVAGLTANHERDRSGGTEDMHVVVSDSDSEFDDAEDGQLTFTFDNPATGVVHVVTGETDDDAEIDDDETSDSESDDEGEGEDVDVNEGEMKNTISVIDDEGFSNNFACLSIHNGNSHMHSTAVTSEPKAVTEEPAGHWRGRAGFIEFSFPSATPCSAEKRPVQPPRSALKSASVTPISRPGHRRSVSFSDGRKDGKILDVDVCQDDSSSADSSSASRIAGDLVTSFFPSAPSARSKRIADMLGNLEDSSFEEESPSKGSQQGRVYDQMQPLSARLMGTVSPDTSIVSRRMLSRSPTKRSPGHSNMQRVTMAGSTPGRRNANTTFLTECSFGVAHDRLVEVITDVQPFEPYWDALSSINLSGRKLDSVARLKEFLPKLDSLNLNNNVISWLSGVPGTVRTLSVASNVLTSLTSFGHLLNLENLDISHNDIDSLQQLGCLRHLRELRADGNKITSLDGLVHFDGLLKLSLQGNKLQDLDFSTFRWSRLELLDLTNNRLENVRGLGALPALISINLDNNSLSAFDQPHDTSDKDKVCSSNPIILHKLRILRLSGNRLKYLDVARFPNLRTLYVDNNCLAAAKGNQRSQKTRQRLLNVQRLSKLENLSARNQCNVGARDSGLLLEGADVRDVKRLYLSGNPSPLPLDPTAQACYNLVYLELAACRLNSLPATFSMLMPNVRALNLNYNFLETDEIARGLRGLTRLRKLTIVGNRMTGTRSLIKMLSTMGQNIEMLDFRMNPCTLGWYLPLLVHDKDDGALLQPSEPPKGKRHSPFLSSITPAQPSFNARGGNAAGLSSGLEEARECGIGAAPLSSTAVAGSASNAHSAQSSTATVVPARAKEKRGPSHWEALDAQFRRGLPDKAYAGRLAYRGLIMRACPQIKVLDCVRITEKERRKAEAFLRRVLKETEAVNMSIRARDQR